MSLVRALDREEVADIQVVVTVQDDNPANIVAVSRRIRGEYSRGGVGRSRATFVIDNR